MTAPSGAGLCAPCRTDATRKVSKPFWPLAPDQQALADSEVLPLDDARSLDLPAITRFVLGELAERLEHPNRPLPFVRMVRGRHTVEHRD